jgi:hypothetical protein
MTGREGPYAKCLCKEQLADAPDTSGNNKRARVRPSPSLYSRSPPPVFKAAPVLRTLR